MNLLCISIANAWFPLYNSRNPSHHQKNQVFATEMKVKIKTHHKPPQKNIIKMPYNPEGPFWKLGFWVEKNSPLQPSYNLGLGGGSLW